MAEGGLTYRVGVDIGGTFTDIIVSASDGTASKHKTPSTPDDFSAAVIEGLRTLLSDRDIAPRSVSLVLHGTTAATNAILERRGARVALLTTRGFRDVLELGRMRHPRLYDVSWQKPEPLVPRRLRIELDERINARGEVERPFAPASLTQVMELLRREQIESAAVCLINAYVNPLHEAAVAEQLRGDGNGLYVTASHEILPEIKEYERTSTTVVNAYVRPIVDRYLGELGTGLQSLGLDCPLLIMQSSGGLVSARTARDRPVQMVESGPAAGVIAARALAQALDLSNVVAFDMGGTTAKASLIEDGEPFDALEYDVGGTMSARGGLLTGGGYTIRVPSIDISEVGAGGGSIVWIDEGGAPHVGPESAGAVPGPACYGQGGTRPTLTDANVVLGYLNSESLAGGAQSIDPEKAAEVIREQVADPMGLDLLEAAHGVHAIAIASMSRVVRAVTSERGRDARDFVLVAFGGAGPAHAVAMAREFEIPTVVVPPNPGLFSAAGLLVADIRRDDVWSHAKGAEADLEEINEAYRLMESRTVAQMVAEGCPADGVELVRLADMRYAGQSFELSIPCRLGEIDAAAYREVLERFEAEHERTYGHRGLGEAVELVRLRLTATSPTAAGHDLIGAPGSSDGRSGERRSTRDVFFGTDEGLIPTDVLRREDVPRQPREGPLIVEDMDATTVIPPGSTIHRDHLDNLVIQP